jgi:hypothetical protein
MQFSPGPTLSNTVSIKPVPSMDCQESVLTRLCVRSASVNVHFNDVAAPEAHGGDQTIFVW